MLGHVFIDECLVCVGLSLCECVKYGKRGSYHLPQGMVWWVAKTWKQTANAFLQDLKCHWF